MASEVISQGFCISLGFWDRFCGRCVILEEWRALECLKICLSPKHSLQQITCFSSLCITKKSWSAAETEGKGCSNRGGNRGYDICKQRRFGGQVSREFIQEPQDREQYLEKKTGKSRKQCHHPVSSGRREALNYAQGHNQLSLQSIVNSSTCCQGPAYKCCKPGSWVGSSFYKPTSETQLGYLEKIEETIFALTVLNCSSTSFQDFQATQADQGLKVSFVSSLILIFSLSASF